MCQNLYDNPYGMGKTWKCVRLKLRISKLLSEKKKKKKLPASGMRKTASYVSDIL